MPNHSTAILHYSSPPVVGGVEAVIQAHSQEFAAAGYPVTVISGRGSSSDLASGVRYLQIPLFDSQHPDILRVNQALENGQVPAEFDRVSQEIESQLEPVMKEFDSQIFHNLFSKHFNLPLTAALDRLIGRGIARNPIQWIHDLSWTSPNSRSKVYPGYPWDLLRRPQPDSTYVTISELRRKEITDLFGNQTSAVRVIYNGVALESLLGLSQEGSSLIQKLGVWQSDLVLLMPVRVTQAKNIEYAIRLVAALKGAGIQPKLILTGPPDPHDHNSWQYYQDLLVLRESLGVNDEMRFVYEEGPGGQPLIIGKDMVGELYRVVDFLFMPSHREGFGMPVIEAGLVGVPVISTPVPAAAEIGGKDVLLFSTANSPEFLADQLLIWIEENPVFQMRKRVRQNYLWGSIFQKDIVPLLDNGG